MITDFITMLAAGVLAGLVAFVARHALRRWAGIASPKWLVPALAGAAMLLSTVHAEYNWYPKMRAGLQDGVEVVLTAQDRNWWRPWTYARPITTRFMAIDEAQVQTPAPGLAQADLLLVARWQPLQAVPVAYDCSGGARADLLNGAQIVNGQLEGGAWLAVGAEDPGLRAVCDAGARHG